MDAAAQNQQLFWEPKARRSTIVSGPAAGRPGPGPADELPGPGTGMPGCHGHTPGPAGAVTVTVTAARSCRDDSDDRGLKY
jgi:hypothetical protein